MTLASMVSAAILHPMELLVSREVPRILMARRVLLLLLVFSGTTSLLTPPQRFATGFPMQRGMGDKGW